MGSLAGETSAPRWWRVLIPAVAAVWLLAPYVGGPAWMRSTVIVASLLAIATAVVMAIAAWRAEPEGERRARSQAYSPATLLAIPLAAVLTVAGTAGAALLAGAGPDVAGDAWRVLVLDRGSLLMVAVAVAPLVYALHRPTADELDRWLARRGVRAASDVERDRWATELRRVRCWRVLPAVLGVGVAFGAGTASNLVAATVGTDSAAYDALVGVRSGPQSSPLPWAMGGYLLGALLAEVTRRVGPPTTTADPTSSAPRSEVATARLLTRTSRAYLTTEARRLVLIVAAGLLALLGLRAVLGVEPTAPGSPPTALGALGTLIVVAATLALCQRIVRRPQRVSGAAATLDDVFRSSTVHAVVGVASAAGLATASEVINDVYSALLDDGSRWPLVPLTVLSAGLFVASIWAWWGLGSGYPGRRPDVEGP